MPTKSGKRKKRSNRTHSVRGASVSKSTSRIVHPDTRGNWDDAADIGSTNPIRTGNTKDEPNSKHESQLQAHLAEHSRLIGESHTAFQRQQTAISVMIILASAITGLISPYINWFSQQDNFKYLVFLPIPFVILGFLHLRDDLKVSEIDRYIWFFLRPKITELSELRDNQLWMYLKVAERMRYGKSLFTYIYFVLSLARYSVPPLVISCSFGLYFWSAIKGPTAMWWRHWSFKLLTLEFGITAIVFGLSFYVLWKGGKYTDETWILKHLFPAINTEQDLKHTSENPSRVSSDE